MFSTFLKKSFISVYPTYFKGSIIIYKRWYNYLFKKQCRYIYLNCEASKVKWTNYCVDLKYCLYFCSLFFHVDLSYCLVSFHFNLKNSIQCFLQDRSSSNELLQIYLQGNATSHIFNTQQAFYNTSQPSLLACAELWACADLYMCMTIQIFKNVLEIFNPFYGYHSPAFPFKVNDQPIVCLNCYTQASMMSKNCV